MYDLKSLPNDEFPHGIIDENGCLVACVRTLVDAREFVAGLNLLESLFQEFPGLADTETPVNGGDVVDFLNANLRFDPEDRLT